MKVIVELEIDKCSDCPHCNYSGESWGEEIYVCKKENDKSMFDTQSIPQWCPLIEKTIEILRKKANEK